MAGPVPRLNRLAATLSRQKTRRALQCLLDMRLPPERLERLCQSLLMLTLPEYATPEDCSWGAFIRWVDHLGGTEGFVTNLIAFDPRHVSIESVSKALAYLKKNCLVPGSMRGGVAGEAAVRLCSWIWLACEEAIAAWDRAKDALPNMTQTDFLDLLDEQRHRAQTSRDLAISRLASTATPQRPRSALA